jgi:hypothetical protein
VLAALLGWSFAGILFAVSRFAGGQGPFDCVASSLLDDATTLKMTLSGEKWGWLRRGRSLAGPGLK